MNVMKYFPYVCVQEDNLAPPAGLADQMFYSTVSCLDRKPSMSSDEEGDIYCQTLPPAVGGDVQTCPSSQIGKMTEQTDQDAQDRDRLKPDQVRHVNLSVLDTTTDQLSLSEEFNVILPCFFLVGRKLDGILRTRMWNTKSPGNRQVGRQVTQCDLVFQVHVKTGLDCGHVTQSTVCLSLSDISLNLVTKWNSTQLIKLPLPWSSFNWLSYFSWLWYLVSN